MRGAAKCGIGLLSGWACAATTVSVRLNGGPSLVVPYGSRRGDTDRCGPTSGDGMVSVHSGYGFSVAWATTP